MKYSLLEKLKRSKEENKEIWNDKCFNEMIEKID